MCAIIGAVPRCNLSTSLLNHRGPDGSNVVSTRDVVFGHARLAILDLTERAAQPLRDSGGRVLLTYNGELYNFRSLGLPSETSDTVALAEWLAANGPGFEAAQLDGMYAFGAWFEKFDTLVLCRDPAGIKPLYVAFGADGDSLAFSSEIKGFFGVEWFVSRPNTDPGVQCDFLQYGYAIPRPVYVSWHGHRAVVPLIPTLIDGVFQICPGQTLTFSSDTAPASRFTNLIRAVGNPETELAAAIHEQAVSDVEVGVQLSGGIDSSLTAWQFARAHPSMQGFYVSVPGESLNEDEWAIRAAETLGRTTKFTFHKIAASEDELRRVLPEVTWHMDEPCIRHPNAVGVFLLCEHVRRNSSVKVLLTGEGADEVFAGYSWHDGRTVEDYDRSRRIFDLGGSEAARNLMRCNSSCSVLERQLAFDRALYLPPILARQDRMSMAHGIEARVPFLANRFLRMPPPLVAGKHSLKRLAAEVYGREFASRRKCGFGLPLEWLASRDLPAGSLDWMNEARPAAKTPFQHWALVAMGMWANEYLHAGWKSRACKSRTPSSRIPEINTQLSTTSVDSPGAPALAAQRATNRGEFEKLLHGETQSVPAPVLHRDGNRLHALAAGLVWKLDSTQYLDGEILKHGIFEAEATRFVHRLIKPAMVVCDVGGNIGYYTLQLSQLVGPKGRVHTFEPSARFRSRLEDHLRMNDCRNVHLCNFGLADRTAQLTLFGGGDSATLGWHDDARTPVVSEQIQVRTLDDYAAEANLQRLDFIKVDIDGSEPLFIKGARKTLHRFKPALLMEFMQLGLMEFKSDALALARELSSLGYVLAPEGTGKPWTDRASFLRDAYNCSVSINVIALPAPDTDERLLRQQAFFGVKTRDRNVDDAVSGETRSSVSDSSSKPAAADGMEMTDVDYWDRDRAVDFKPWVVNETSFSSLFEKYLPANNTFTCAEIGAYPGGVLCDLAKRLGYQPVAIEYSKHTEHIEEMFRANGIKNGRVIQEDFFKVRGEQFDVVTSFGFIEHFSNPHAVMAAHFELIKPGGWLVMSVPRLDGFQGLLYELTYTPETWKRVASAHNLEILNLHALRRTCEQFGEIVFAGYVRGASIYFDWNAPFVRPEYRWLVRYLNRISAAAGDIVPSDEFYSPHIFLVARKPVTPKVSNVPRIATLIRQAQDAIARSDVVQAETVLRECIVTDPGLLEAQAALFDVLAAGGNADGAITLLETAPKPMPQAVEIWNRLGALRLARGEWAAAEKSFLEAISWSPDKPETLAGLLTLYTNQQRKEEAQAVRCRIESLAKSRSSN